MDKISLERLAFKKGFYFALGIGMAVFLGLNLLFAAIGHGIADDFNIANILEYLLGPATVAPYAATSAMYNTLFLASENGGAIVFLNIGYLISPTVAAIITGWLSGAGKWLAIGTWFLIAGICAVILYVINIAILNYNVPEEIFKTLLPGIIVGIFYGIFAILINPELL
ncbi:MAG: membrane protein of unknown function [Promethearchaeota archaeon]|nr:MAG: membrane protein of unknown function [Candidatus Lokiarchaeota archaeon]